MRDMTASPHDYTDLQPSTGDRLRLARERRTGLDQGEFAELISVSRGTVSNYERDHLPGGTRQRLVLNAWAQATGVSRTWLETGEPDAPTPPRPDGGVDVARAAQLEALAQRKRARTRHTAEYIHAAA